MAVLAAGLVGAVCSACGADSEPVDSLQHTDAAVQGSDAGDAVTGTTRDAGLNPRGELPAPPRCEELQQIAKEFASRPQVCAEDADCTRLMLEPTCVMPLMCGVLIARDNAEERMLEARRLDAEAKQVCRVMDDRTSRSWYCGIAECETDAARCDPLTKLCVYARAPRPDAKTR